VLSHNVLPVARERERERGTGRPTLSPTISSEGDHTQVGQKYGYQIIMGQSSTGRMLSRVGEVRENHRGRC